MHFQLFIPNCRGQNPQMLIDVGLADFVAGAEYMDVGQFATGPAAHGTDGTDGTDKSHLSHMSHPCHGTLIAWRRPGQPQMGYQPDKQIWLPAVPRPAEDLAGGRYFIGFWNDAPVVPRDLARPYPQQGARVALGDGHEWLLPSAKELDADMVVADDGSWRFEVQRRFHAFNLEYLKWMHFFGTAGPDDEFLFADGAEFILQALRINYRITPEVVSAQRLFTKEIVLRAMLAVMGVTMPAAEQSLGAARG